MTYLWFVTDVMLFFIVLSFQISLYFKNRKAAYLLSAFLIVASSILTGIIVMGYNVRMNALTDQETGFLVYYRPWCKVGIYQIGVIFGMFFFEYRHFEKGN